MATTIQKNQTESPISFISGQFIPVGCIVVTIVMALIYIFKAWRNRRYFVIPSNPSTPIHYRILSNNEESLNNLVVSDSDNENETQ